MATSEINGSRTTKKALSKDRKWSKEHGNKAISATKRKTLLECYWCLAPNKFRDIECYTILSPRKNYSKYMATLKGWRYAALVGGLVGGIALAIYPIIIDPMLNPEKYKKIQAVTRANIKQEEIQPGNMKVWSDPFDRKKS